MRRALVVLEVLLVSSGVETSECLVCVFVIPINVSTDSEGYCIVTSY